MPFSPPRIVPKVLEGVRAAGYTDPTPIQLRAIPLILEGRDIIGSAQTGTGKTAAFALPVISRLGQRGKLRALVLEPTRELAAQVETAVRDYARFTDLRTVVVFGGTGYGRQDQALRQGVDILVATPGRLLDQIQRKMVKLNDIEILILDEADRMLDMGFMPDVRRILERCPKTRQTMLFSATVPPEIEQLCRWALHNPQTIEIGQRRMPAETVTHALYPVDVGQKQALLEELLRRTDYDQVLIFCRTKNGADRVARHLHNQDHAVAVLHSTVRSGARTGAQRISQWPLRSHGGYGYRRPRYRCSADQPCDQFRRAAPSGRLCPSHRPHRSRPERRRCVYDHDGRRCPGSGIYRAFHRPENSTRKAG